MSSLYSIKDIADADVERLKAAGYQTTESLWNKLGEDQPDTLTSLASATGIPAGKLAALLAADIAQEAPFVEGGFVRRHWIDLVLAAAAVLLIWAVFLWRGAPNVANGAGEVVLRVPLKEVPATSLRKPPYRATLAFSPRSSGEAVLEDVTVMAVHEGATPAATITLRTDRARSLSRLLGSADLYLWQPKE